MFDKLEVLDKRQHADMTYSCMDSYAFARSLTALPIALSEFNPASGSFPLVFSAGGDKGVEALALLSLRGEENPFVGEEGQWLADYLPAHLRRYPFILGETGNPDRFVLMIDRDAPHFSRPDGEPLFVDGEGEPSSIVKRAKEFLTKFQRELIQSRDFLKPLADADVLVERQFVVNRNGQKQVAVRGFRVVDQEKLKALDDATLASWVRSGLMGVVMSHLRSLSHADALIQRQYRQSDATEVAG